PVVAGLDIGYAQRIASGGDFLDLLLTSSARLVLMLLDICGRNTETIATSVQRLFRQRAAELFTTDANDSEALTVLTLEVNREILRAASLDPSGGVRCTAGFLACFDPQIGTLWYINAGHTPAIVQDGAAVQLGASGVPLGLFSHAVHDAHVQVLAPGAALALLSKGALEHEQFGLEEAGALVSRRGAASASELCEHLLQAAEQAAPRGRFHREPSQDQTAVALIRAL